MKPPQETSPQQRVQQALRGLAMALLALLILFEEWGWDPLQRALARIARLPVLRNLEAAVERLSPPAALVVLLLPTLLLVPIKLLALWQISQGQPLRGLLVVVVAKLVGTALLARLFTLTRPALMQWPWFARAYQRWTTWKQALLQRVRRWRPWRIGRAVGRRVRRWLARWRRG